MISSVFSKCNLLPLTSDKSPSSSIDRSADGKWKTFSYFLDSAGRASFSVPLLLEFDSELSLQEFLDKDCFHPRIQTDKDGSNASIHEKLGGLSLSGPSDNITNKDDNNSTTNTNKTENRNSLLTSRTSSINIEAKVLLTIGSGEAMTSLVETVTVLSTRREGPMSVVMDVEVIVRVTRPGGARIDSAEASGARVNVDVSAVLTEVLPQKDPLLSMSSDWGLHTITMVDVQPGFVRPTHAHTPYANSLARHTSLVPVELHVSLMQALSIEVKSVSGPYTGQTFLALTMRHSNTHKEPVTVTSIALHPSHSRCPSMPTNNATGGVEFHDTSKSVKWGFCASSDPGLPLVLEPNEAVSTILMVEATEDDQSRTFQCPVSVTAVIGRKEQIHPGHRHFVVSVADAEWTTSRAAIEPADAIRLDLTLPEVECTVGSPLRVLIDAYNMSSETRDLVLSVDADDDLGDRNARDNTEDRSAVVATKDGYEFQVWGMADPMLEEKEHRLLSVDVALLLGEIQGQSTARTELRIIPLREGTLRIPNFQLVDKKCGKKYKCVHKLRAVAKPMEVKM